MARKPRIFVPYAIYHVYCRVGRGESVFTNYDSAHYWLDTVREAVPIHKIKALAWCLMSNHYHLVVKSGPAPLWRAMARIQRRVSWHHNRKNGVKGRLWQSRYRAKLVLDERYYRQAVAYVHLNPVAAAIVEDPADYRWSGHCELIGTAANSLIDLSEALMSYGDDLASQRREYLSEIRLIQEARWYSEGIRSLPWWKDVADDEQTVEAPDAPAEAVWFDDTPVSLEEERILPLETLAHWFEDAIPDAEWRLQSRSQRPRDARLRRLFAVLAVLEMGYRNTEVSAVLRRSPSSVSRWLSEGLTLRSEDAQFKKDLTHVVREIRRRFSEL